MPWRGSIRHEASRVLAGWMRTLLDTNRNMRTDPPGEGQRLYFMRHIDSVWTSPKIAPFTNGITVPVQRPVFSPDGSHLYIESSSNPVAEDDSDIYVVEQEGDGWSSPVPVSPLINTGAMERLHCVTFDGSLVFSRDPYTRREKIYISRFVDGAFVEPEQLQAPFDSDAYELAIVIAPDESYMLIGITRTGLEDELYISYREADGSWTERIRAPYQCGGFLALSPDGEYLFFLGEGIYWVDTSFVEELYPTSANGAGEAICGDWWSRECTACAEGRLPLTRQSRRRNGMTSSSMVIPHPLRSTSVVGEYQDHRNFRAHGNNLGEGFQLINH